MAKQKIPFANHNIPHSEAEINEIIENASKAYEQFMDALKFDWRNDPNSENTPKRVAKSFVRDLIAGCYEKEPEITVFPGRGYDGVIFEGNIPFTSICAHHHLPFIGVVHAAYIPGKDVMGLSKLNRVVNFYSRRQQIQEDLTTQIHDAINTACKGNKGVAIMVSSTHSCVSCRGVKHTDCVMKTSKLSGDFLKDAATRAEFYAYVADSNKR